MAQQRGRGAAVSVEAFIYVRSLRLGPVERGRPVTKLVLQSLADRADEAFSCFPSVPLIAAECEISDRAVQRHMAWLRKQGYVSDKERFRPTDGSQSSNRYFIHGPWDDFGGTGRPFKQIAYPEREIVDGAFRTGTKGARGVSLASPPGRHLRHPPGDASVTPSGDARDTPGATLETPWGVPSDTPRGDRGDTPGVSWASPLEPPEEPSEEAPPPPPVVTAEERAGARAGQEQKGAASPRDLSAETAGGTAGTSPTGGPAVAKSAPTDKAFDRMAADVVRTLPRVLQPANDDEGETLRWLIADKLSEGYPVGIVRQALSADPPEYVRSKAAFVGHRLASMAPWVPPARSAADTAAVDEIRGRRAEQAGTAPPQSAAAARAAFEASRDRRPRPKTQQGKDGGPA